MNALYQSRLSGIADQIDFYLWKYHDSGTLSKTQQSHLQELCNTIVCFGIIGKLWYEEGIKTLKELSQC